MGVSPGVLMKSPFQVATVVEHGWSVPEIMKRFAVGRTQARHLRAAADGYLMASGGRGAVDILVVGDQHITPGQPTEHFEWLAALIAERKPDVVLSVGDVIDNVSFSSHACDAEKARFSYIEELDAAISAWSPAVDAAKQVDASLVVTLGNHDDLRLQRVIRQHPWLSGAIKELGPMLTEAGWDVFDYQTPAKVAGIAFSHTWVSGIMGKPISGVNPARAMAMKIMDSALAGHSHAYNIRTTTTPLGRRILTGTVGCFIHPDSDVSNWAGPQVIEQYDRGVVYLHSAANGHADVEWISMDRLRRTWGA